jgi:hypothetical protein
VSRRVERISLIRPAEWWNDRIQPWVHYVPIQMDYSDLYDTVAFVSARARRANKTMALSVLDHVVYPPSLFHFL